MESALRVSGLCKRYPGFTLSDVSFTLERGRVMGFIGRNGAGKTTTIKCIMGLIRRDAGSVEILGGSHGTEESGVKERIGFVYDEHGFFGGMTVNGVGKMARSFYSTWRDDEFLQRMRQFSLDPRRKTRELSHGQRTKLALAVALSHGAELLIMDEPTSGLDPVFRAELIDILFDLIQDDRKAIFFSTHLTSDLERIADSITFIDQGRIVLSEPKDDLLERYRIVKGPVLTEEGRAMCVGARESRSGFEALTTSAEELAAIVGNRAVVEKASLEDLMVYMAKGAAGE
jgi:ABC-2 type transport system ATP-binding protein